MEKVEYCTSLLRDNSVQPWLVWLNGLNAALKTKRLLVQFPVKAHACVAGQVSCWGHVRGHCFFLAQQCFSPSLPLCLKINK